MPDELRAYGAVLWRGDPAAPEVALVHRPRYDDWTLPKGKPHSGEHPWRTAAREVEEETGCRGALGRRVHTIRYLLDGRPKRVRFWYARLVAEGSFTPGDEVDGLRWLPVAAAREAVSYPGDAETLDRFVPPYDTTAVLLARHGSAGDPDSWQGDDRLRPLDDVGQRQARAVGETVPAFAPARVLSAPALRCVETVRPLGLPVEIDPLFGEEVYWDARGEARKRLLALAAEGVPTVIGSQGGVIPDLVAAVSDVKDPKSRKGSVWALTFAGREVVGAEYADRLAPGA